MCENGWQDFLWQVAYQYVLICCPLHHSLKDESSYSGEQDVKMHRNTGHFLYKIAKFFRLK